LLAYFQIMHQYFTDESDKKDKFLSFLSTPQKIVLTAHQNPDGDAFGSALGLYALLKQMNHEVHVISPNKHSDYIGWMPGADQVIDFENELEHGRAKRIIKEATLIFCLDFSSLNRLGRMEGAIKEASAKKVLIDHHQMPENFVEFVFWNEKAAATCQLIYELIENLELLNYVNLDVATCLYTGILTDTGSFKFESTSKEVHRIAGELINVGINPNRINRKLFDQNSLNRVRFLGFALNEKLNYLEEYRVAYFFFTKEELERYDSKNGDTEGLVNYGLSISGSVMSAIFIEREDMIKISFRSVDDFSVADLSRSYFLGGGHKNAAGGKSTDSLESTVNRFLELLPLYKKRLLSQPR
jgi:phosphoesterase RecJ-like protein